MTRSPVSTGKGWKWAEATNEAGVKLRTFATVELEVPTSMGAGHRQHLLELVLAEATRLGLRWKLK